MTGRAPILPALARSHRLPARTRRGRPAPAVADGPSGPRGRRAPDRMTGAQDPAHGSIAFPGGEVHSKGGLQRRGDPRTARGPWPRPAAGRQPRQKRAFAAYPAFRALPRPDWHIDHRRRPVSIGPAASPTGNLACGRLPGNRPQIGFTAAFRRGHTTRRPVLPVRDRRSFPAERRATGLTRPSLPPEVATPGRLVPLPLPSPFILAQVPRGVRGAGPPADRPAPCAGRNLRDRTCQ